MSYFHDPDAGAPQVFGDGKWTYDIELDEPCPGGGTRHTKRTAQYPLPAPPQDPITLLTGHGHLEVTGDCDVTSYDDDDKIVRTGD